MDKKSELEIPSKCCKRKCLRQSSKPQPISAEKNGSNNLKAEKQLAVEAQGNAVRALKAARAAKFEIDAVIEALERRLFYIPSFKIYHDVAGLYNNGPPHFLAPGQPQKFSIYSYYFWLLG